MLGETIQIAWQNMKDLMLTEVGIMLLIGIPILYYVGDAKRKISKKTLTQRIIIKTAITVGFLTGLVIVINAATYFRKETSTVLILLNLVALGAIYVGYHRWKKVTVRKELERAGLYWSPDDANEEQQSK